MNFDKSEADAKSNIRHLSRYGRGGRFLDLGSNIGAVARAAAYQFQRVIAVEAHPETFEYAEKIGFPENVIHLNRAVWSEGGKTLFASTPENSIGSSARPTKRLKSPPPGYYREVQSIGINELLKDFNPRVVKIDIEGAEYEILPVADWPESVDWIQIEFHGTRGEKGTKRFYEMKNILLDSNFRLQSQIERGIFKALFFVAIFKRDSL